MSADRARLILEGAALGDGVVCLFARRVLAELDDDATWLDGGSMLGKVAGQSKGVALSPAERAKRYRERHGPSRTVTEIVTDRHGGRDAGVTREGKGVGVSSDLAESQDLERSAVKEGEIRGEIPAEIPVQPVTAVTETVTRVTKNVTAHVTAVTRPVTPKGSRIPSDFAPTAATMAWAAEQGEGVDAMAVVPEFVDWWTAKAGAGGVKLDWQATLRTWIRRMVRDGQYPRLPDPPPPPPRRMNHSAAASVQSLLSGIGNGGGTAHGS